MTNPWCLSIPPGFDLWSVLGGGRGSTPASPPPAEGRPPGAALPVLLWTVPDSHCAVSTDRMSPACFQAYPSAGPFTKQQAGGWGAALGSCILPACSGCWPSLPWEPARA